MGFDPLTSFTFQTPPRKVRKLAAVQPNPPRLSGLLSAFGARQLPMSASRMEPRSDRRGLRPLKERFSYAESESDVTPQTSPGSSLGDSFESSKTSIEVHDDDDSEDELQSSGNAAKASPGNDELDSDDVIHGTLAYHTHSHQITDNAQQLQPDDLAPLASFQRGRREAKSAMQRQRNLSKRRRSLSADVRKEHLS